MLRVVHLLGGCVGCNAHTHENKARKDRRRRPSERAHAPPKRRAVPIASSSSSTSSAECGSCGRCLTLPTEPSRLLLSLRRAIHHLSFPATNIKLFVRGVGDDLSTWTVRSVYIEVLPPLLGRDLISGSTAVNPDDPSPQSAVNATPAQLANAVVPHLWFCGVQIHIIVRTAPPCSPAPIQLAPALVVLTCARLFLLPQ